ncbi:amino acid adenylation domain-containing protein [Croceitalea marina]|uniref:Amino acid adenylation domain-containing protein n=1 Tax=Croceitalea marina TaxID=1775166 RepID=A0ABW5MSW3_9FLAO
MSIKEHRLVSNKYWAKKLKGTDPVVGPGPREKSVCSKTVHGDDLRYFQKLTGSNGISEYTVLYGIFNALLKRYLDVGTGFILSDKVKEPKRLLLLKLHSHGKKSLKESLGAAKREVQDVYRFSEHGPNSAGGFSFVDYAFIGLSYGKGLKNNFDKCRFVLGANKNHNHLELTASFDPSYVDGHVADHFLKTLGDWLINLEAYLGKQIDEIDILSEGEKGRILNKFNSTKRDFPTNKTIVDLFEEQVKKSPENIAATYKKESLTYLELNRKANQLADYISGSCPECRGDVVGVLMPKSIDAIISYLAILKLGAIYMPIDASYPKNRIEYILKDSNAKFIIGNSGTLASVGIEKENIVDIENVDYGGFSNENLDEKISPSDVAYLIYTSGSTGNPKGVLASHSGNVNMSLDQTRQFRVTENDRIAWFASIAFDASISEMMMAFYRGATLSIPTEEQIKNNGELLDFINKESISVVTFPPSYLDLIDAQDLKTLRCIITAGEAANPIKTKEILSQGIACFNAYGPTEYSVCTSIYSVPKKFDAGKVPIGNPIANTKVYVLDDNLVPVPIGVTGTLYVSGVGLAKGYLNRDELTNEKFVPNPFDQGTLMYNTGDLAKWLPDGNIVFEGRKDFQVKINGHRVELGEVENALYKYSEDILQAVAEPKSLNGTKHLTAYYTIKAGHSIEKTRLRTYLKETLPEYMVPSFFVQLKEIPINQNGKVDRKLLTRPKAKDIIQKEYIAPRNETERQLTEIWQEVLRVDKVGITDDFYEMGGNSLMVVLILNNVLKNLGMQLNYKDFFANPTIEAIAKKTNRKDYCSIPKAKNQEYYPLVPSQHRIWVLSQLDEGSQAYIMSGAVLLKGT